MRSLAQHRLVVCIATAVIMTSNIPAVVNAADIINFETSSQWPILYAYRTNTLRGAGGYYDIRINDDEIAPLRQGQFFKIQVLPGKNDIWMTVPSSSQMSFHTELNMEAGKNYFINVTRNTFAPNNIVVSEEEGEREINKLVNDAMDELKQKLAPTGGLVRTQKATKIEEKIRQVENGQIEVLFDYQYRYETAPIVR